MSSLAGRTRFGVDLVALERLDRLLTESPWAAQVLFTDRELSINARPSRRLAWLSGRFAAKEATLKVLGTGMGRDMDWRQIETRSSTSGAPELRLYGEVARVAKARGLTDWGISLSHSQGLVIACAWASEMDPSIDHTTRERAHA